MAVARSCQAPPEVAERGALEAAAEDKTPIMIFVGSRGCIQIHTGRIARLLDTHGWFNILDPDFNLHLRDSAVARVFSVRKPTDDGLVISLPEDARTPIDTIIILTPKILDPDTKALAR